MTRRTRTNPLAALLFAAALPLAACGTVAEEEESANPIEEFGTEVDGGNPGPDEAVTEDIKITALGLEYPDDGLWQEGDDVLLYAAIANTGTTGDQLVEVTSDAFADATLTALDGTEGAIDVPEEDNVYLEPDGPPSVLLTGLATELRSSESVPVTFVFEQAGEVTMEAPVVSSPPGEGGFEAPEDPTPED
ncbi:copper chaperone PCu(A)C [Blastococcus sp. KM273128]|uniref:copper chaperone PCu(A)C n=1 Tax=Blastococcus sp. KM273128 TaxID=2570314 RepID=UPI001F189F1B|nr:copper chaperone PCu(A)C [Blastococcus sp. KM273128]MCF6746431.1 copper chaperone PCu(A)C [Blastococcus sp. KM273128]